MVVSHVTLAVADLARSERFYSEALGFTRLYAAEPEAAFKRLLERPDAASLAMTAMQCGDFRIELLQIGPASGPSPLDTPPGLGLRHLAVRTEDLEAAAASIVRAGGQAHPQTEVSTAAGRFMMCGDPDGLRILLMQAAAAG